MIKLHISFLPLEWIFSHSNHQKYSSVYRIFVHVCCGPASGSGELLSASPRCVTSNYSFFVISCVDDTEVVLWPHAWATNAFFLDGVKLILSFRSAWYFWPWHSCPSPHLVHIIYSVIILSLYLIIVFSPFFYRLSPPGCVWCGSDKRSDSDRSVWGSYSWRYQGMHRHRFWGEECESFVTNILMYFLFIYSTLIKTCSRLFSASFRCLPTWSPCSKFRDGSSGCLWRCALVSVISYLHKTSQTAYLSHSLVKWAQMILVL